MSPFPKTKASVFDRYSVVARLKRIENNAFSNELVWLSISVVEASVKSLNFPGVILPLLSLLHDVVCLGLSLIKTK